MATTTYKTTAGTWYSVHCTESATLTAEIDGKEIPVCSLDEAGSTVFCAPDAHVTITTEGNYRILPTRAPGANVTGGASSKALNQHIADTTAHLTASEHDGLTELLSGGGGTAYLPDSTFNSWAFLRTGKVYRSRVYKYAYNPASALPSGEAKLLDNAGLNHTCSTDTVEGTDDYASIHLFTWYNCNYIRQSDGSPRITALEGQPAYATTGAVDVGVCGPCFWYSVTDTEDGQHQEWTISDSPHPELGLVPWVECVRGDGSIAPYWCHSKYMSGTASDGLPRSQPGLVPIHYVSQSNVLTAYAKKGTGYRGGGAAIHLFGVIFDIIKNGTKHSQGIHAGMTNCFVTYACAATRETVDSTFTLTAAQAAYFSVGASANVGTTSTTDRNSSTNHDVADQAIITAKTTNDDGTVTLTLSCAAFAMTATRYISTTAWAAGATDSVIGHHDGSPVSNTDGRHPYRVQGTEYAVGWWTLCADLARIQSSGVSSLYVAETVAARSSNATTIAANYKKVTDSLPLTSTWVSDIAVDTATGAFWPSATATGDSLGHRDYYYTTNSNGSYEVFCGGGLYVTSLAGSVCLDAYSALGFAHAHYAARD